MEDWFVEIEGEKKFSGKALIGWNAADKKIAYRSMGSLGGMGMGTVVFDRQAKTSTLTSKGVDGKGEKMSRTTEITMKDKDTFVIQDFDRKGGFAEGDSPKYTYKRVK
jgi:hypothetical protein